MRVLTAKEIRRTLRCLAQVLKSDIGATETDFINGEDDDSVGATQKMIRLAADFLEGMDHKGLWRRQHDTK